ncbi:hypothetical protein [Pseudonocardia sp. D17]|uniref:hypothetical protein n=1 Tax=Pseudonocardia sp. D17 TaxID=882661 RepID=UPI002B394AC2|nr:hypothetical protein PSD17_39490 [Pseudonocardia sp. D17]
MRKPRASERTHTCPGGCGRQVPDRYYACGPDWERLPKEFRDAITGNERGTVEHVDAMLNARLWFRGEDPRP